VLHELEGTPVREVARLLGVAEVTVRWHLSAARRELARVILEDRT
jgi:DNA-directed RNA polymerase specialized sigma24 family protein